MKIVLDLKNDLIGMGHGLSLSKVQSPNSVITRASNELVSEIDFFEAVQERQIANSIYDQIYDYPCEEDLKMDKVIDIYPQVNRLLSDKFERRYIEDFDRKKAVRSEDFSVEYRNGVKVLRLSKTFTQPALIPRAIGNFGSLSNNGTWVAGGDAGNLTLDKVNYVSGTASLRFDLDGAGTTWYVEAGDITPIDISEQKDGSLFNWAWLPDASKHTNIVVRVGSSPTDYYEYTNTTQFSGALTNGWNQIQSAILEGTVTGSPDLTAVSYVRVGGTYDGDPIEGMRLDSLVTILGTKHLIKYYTDRLFKDATTGELKNTVTNNADIIMLESSSYNGLLYKSAEFMAQQVQDQGGSIDVEYFLGLYSNWKNRYMSAYCSQTITPKQSYWDSTRYKGRPHRTSNNRR